MTLYISATKAAAMASNGNENNPLVTRFNHGQSSGATLSSDDGVLADGALANAVSGSTADRWRPDVFGTNVTFRVTKAAAYTCSFMGVCGHNIATYGGSIRPQYSTDGGSTWLNCDSMGAETPTTNENIGFYFSDIDAADFRINITGLTAGDGVTVAVVYIGRGMQFDQRFFSGFAPPIAPTNVDLIPNVSAGGNFLKSDYRTRGISYEFGVRHLTQDWVRGVGSSFPAFQENFNQGEPFFMAWRPTDYPDDLAYCWRDGPEMIATNMGVRGYMEVAGRVRAYDDKS